MGLDVYTGPLTRYYTGNWKTIVQQYAEANNMQFEIMRMLLVNILTSEYFTRSVTLWPDRRMI